MKLHFNTFIAFTATQVERRITPRREFRYHLEANSARQVLIYGGNGHGFDGPLSVRNHRPDREPFRTNRGSVACIFHVATRVDFAVGPSDRGADLVVAIGGMRLFPDRLSRQYQFENGIHYWMEAIVTPSPPSLGSPR